MLENFLHYPESYREDFHLPLNDASLDIDYPEIDLTKKVTEDLTALKVKLRLAGGYQVSVYNQPEDDEKESWYNKKLAEKYPDACFVKASVRGSLKGLNAQLADLDFGIKGNSSLTFTDFRKFLAATPFEKALDDLRKAYRVVLRPEDVMKLAPGEQLAMTYMGQLSAALELSFSDVYQMTFSILKSMIPKDTGLEVKSSPKLSAAFTCMWKDAFSLQIERKADDHYGASVKKLKSRSFDVEGNVAVSLALGKDKWWDSLLDSLTEALLGTSLEKWDNLLTKEKAQWSKWEKELVSFVVKRLGWEVDLQQEHILQEQYNKLRKDLSEKVEAFLKQQIALEVGVAYERLKEEETVLEASFTNQALKRYHEALVKGRWEELAGAQGVVYEKFLHKQLIKKATKWGVGIKLGSLHLFSKGNYDYREKKTIDYSHEQPQEHISITSQRAHEEQLRDKYTYFIQLKGETPGYVVKPHAGMFDFQWQTHWETTQRKIRKEEWEQYIDWAVLWRCVPESARNGLMDKWTKTLKGEKRVTVALDMIIPAGMFDLLVPLLQEPPHQYVVQSLAEAVPYRPDTMRSTQKKRAAVYYRIWDKYLQTGAGQSALMSAMAQELLDTVDPELADWEGSFANRHLTADDGWMSMAGILQSNPLAEYIERLQLGMGFMHQAMLKHKDYRVPFEQGFKKYRSILMMNGVNDTFNLRFLGRYLLNLAFKAGVLDEVKTTFTLQKEEETME
ncbi:MAG: hypothetical protein ACQESW_10640, partial [Bacteroidota bacterium]